MKNRMKLNGRQRGERQMAKKYLIKSLNLSYVQDLNSKDVLEDSNNYRGWDCYPNTLNEPAERATLINKK